MRSSRCLGSKSACDKIVGSGAALVFDWSMPTTRTLGNEPDTQEILSNLLPLLISGILLSHGNAGARMSLYVLTITFLDPHTSILIPGEAVCRAAKIL